MAFDPFSAAIAGGGLIANLLQGQQAKRQAAQNRADALRMFAEEMRLAKSGRTDAYGNRVYYDEGLGEWKTALTPQQLRLAKAQEREQLVGLTEDAARNRAARKRQAEIGKTSAEDYNTQRAEYLYGPRRSEKAIFDEISKLVARQRSQPDVFASRQNVRMGSPLIAASGSGRSDRGVSDALLARKAALEEFNAREGARVSRNLPVLEFFRGGAGGGGGASISGPESPNRLSQTQDAMAQLAASVSGRGNDRIAKANEGLTAATSKRFPSLSDSARLIASLRGQPIRASNKPTAASSTSYAKDDRSLDDILYGIF